MEKLVFDSGIKNFQINDGGVMRFNPSDPNVYARLLESTQKIQKIEETLVEKANGLQTAENADGEAALKLLKEADSEVKKILSWVFGEDNDFDKIFDGVNVMAVGSNGERVITNFIYAVLPVIEEGAKKCADEQIGTAVAQAQQNRAARRAKK